MGRSNPVIMGLYGVTEVLLNVEQGVKSTLATKKIDHLLPIRRTGKTLPSLLRGDDHSSILGILPGGGGSLPFSLMPSNGSFRNIQSSLERGH